MPTNAIAESLPGDVSELQGHWDSQEDNALEVPDTGSGDEIRYRDDIGVLDQTWMSLASLATGAVGVLVGSQIGANMAGECESTEHLGCLGHGLEEASIGGLLGYAVLAPMGTFAYGQLMGFDGSMLSAFAGATLGLGLGVGVMALGDGHSVVQTVGSILLIGGPLIGSVAGYHFSVHTRPPNRPRSASLLDFNSTDGLRLSVPAMGMIQDANGTRFQVGVLSGTF